MTSTTQQVFRQRSSLVLAAGCGVTGLVLLGDQIRSWGQYQRPSFVAWVLLGLASAWAIFLRPAVVLDVEGVTLRNVLRDVHIPWAALTHAESRWNLKVYDDVRGYTAWAISSQIERPRGISGQLFGKLSPGRVDEPARRGAEHNLPDPKVTAATVASSVEQAKREYDESVAQGRRPSGDGRVRVTWVPLVLVVLLLPVAALAALSLG